ncbi:hypothetical protein FQN57_007400 [Myotisia sp. PD_48]|nr:hypothetical protein FQN57_007400 [Myotisia sp. PD_48]
MSRNQAQPRIRPLRRRQGGVQPGRGAKCRSQDGDLIFELSYTARKDQRSMSLDPDEIAPSTMAELLGLYDTTIANVYRSKIKAKTKKESDDDVESKISQFIELDNWRYALSDTLQLRHIEESSRSEQTVCFLTRDELVRLMEWKLKHGSFRPALMGLILSNPESDVLAATGEAFSALDSTPNAYPESSLLTLSKKLRGVGPATASLVLSVAPPSLGNTVPFFSDEMYHWLCPQPTTTKSSSKAGSSKLKYTMKEYRQLWDVYFHLRERIGQVDDPTFSLQQIEKIAFVLGHLGASGYQGDRADAATKSDNRSSRSKKELINPAKSKIEPKVYSTRKRKRNDG